MVDLQVVFPQEVVELTSVRTLPGTPRAIDVLGKDFRSIDEVRINDLVSPRVVVVSRTRLLADVPEIVGGVIESVMVTSRQLTVTPRSLIKLKIGRVASKVSGILRLVQVFLKILLTTPGTDIFSQQIGGDALKNLGATFSKSQSGAIVSDFVIAVQTTVRQIIAIQGRDPAIPRDERLLAARVMSASYSHQELGLFVSVEINSQAGQAALANILV
jgi:hypothetical protein